MKPQARRVAYILDDEDEDEEEDDEGDSEIEGLSVRELKEEFKRSEEHFQDKVESAQSFLKAAIRTEAILEKGNEKLRGEVRIKTAGNEKKEEEMQKLKDNQVKSVEEKDRLIRGLQEEGEIWKEKTARAANLTFEREMKLDKQWEEEVENRVILRLGGREKVRDAKAGRLEGAMEKKRGKQKLKKMKGEVSKERANERKTK